MGMPDIEVNQVDGYNVAWMNHSGLPDDKVLGSVRQTAAALTEWVLSSQTPGRRISGLLDRNAYVLPHNPIQQMMLARQAVQDDDIVGGTADVTEGLMFQGCKWEGTSADDCDVFNQIATDINLDAFLRSAYRELFTHSQVVVASWWEQKEYTVRGFNPPDPTPPPAPDPVTGVLPKPQMPKRGPRRRKKYSVYVPTQLTILDSLRVVPVGNRLWGGDRLAWHGTAEEMSIWDSGLDSPSTLDPTMQQLLLGRYNPSREEAIELANLGVNPKNLLELNPVRVWRHTLTRPSYARWPEIRLKGVFGLLDLKRQLMEADRVNLIGAANYILLVKKGDKDNPAYQHEIDNLNDNFQVMAKLPVIVSDHRLTIEIISPKTDLTLNREKYDVIDARILARVLGAFTVAAAGAGSGRSDNTLTLGRMVARLLESRRHMLKRAVEQNVARVIMDLNPDAFDDEPNLAFTPAAIQLDSDAQITQMVMALRAQKEISREAVLEFAGFDQAVEADRRRWEAESGMDEIFQTAIPFSSPDLAPGNGTSLAGPGNQGGRPKGGGKPDSNPTGAGKTTGGPSTKKASQ